MYIMNFCFSLFSDDSSWKAEAEIDMELFHQVPYQMQSKHLHYNYFQIMMVDKMMMMMISIYYCFVQAYSPISHSRREEMQPHAGRQSCLDNHLTLSNYCAQVPLIRMEPMHDTLCVSDGSPGNYKAPAYSFISPCLILDWMEEYAWRTPLIYRVFTRTEVALE